MDGADGSGAGRGLRDVEVRPVRGAEERRRRDAPMAEHHHLPHRGLFGKSLRQVAVRGEARRQEGLPRGGVNMRRAAAAGSTRTTRP